MPDRAEPERRGERTGPERIGPYAIAGVLGQGGMGVVYRAQHAETGEWCALKTVSRLDAARLGLLRREIHALGRFRHPGIVRVLAHGSADGRPWYAMELLEPVTFAALLGSLWQHSSAADSSGITTVTSGLPGVLPLAQIPPDGASAAVAPSPTRARPVAGQGRLPELARTLGALCSPLALLHGEGLVHCDLKPGNIFLRSDGSPVIGDFGLAAHVPGARGRDVLEVEREVRGTYAYMAPEQIRGEQVDARADLYALGCMLYEAVTGRAPFVGDVLETIAGHLDREPVPVSSFATDVPPGLETLITRLLAKQPRLRIGFADDVAKVLARVCGLPIPGETPGVRPYVYRSSLFGREEDLRQIKPRVLQARSGRGAVLLIGGESGVGKTRLATELGLYASRMDFGVVTGQCTEPTDGRAAGTPLEPLLPLLRHVADRCLEDGVQATRRLLGEHGAVLAAFEPGLAGVPGADTWPEPARLEPHGARRRLFAALFATMEALAGANGLLVVLDDLQWADELTAGFLAASASRFANTGVLVLGTYRSEDRHLLAPLLAADGVEPLTIGRLGTSSIGGMVGDMLSMDEPAASFVRFLARESEGNPFFVAEYLRAAISERILSRDDAGRWRLAGLYAFDEEAYAESLPLPSSLRELAALRLKDLSPAALAVVDAAAVLGRDLDASLLEAMVALPGEAAIGGIQELIGRQILEEVPGRLRFLHHKLREFSYEQLAPPARVGLHRRAADAIETAAGPQPALAQHADLARHRSLGEQPALALAHYRQAAALAADVHANAQAADFYRLALAEYDRLPAGTDQAGRLQVHERLGDLLALTGRQAEAREAYRAAFGPAGTRHAIAIAGLHRKVGKTWEVHHEHVDALRCFDLALAALGPVPAGQIDDWLAEWLRIRLDRAAVHYWRGAPDLMQEELDLVRPQVREDMPRLAAGFHEGLAFLGYRREQYLLSAGTVAHAQAFHDAAVAAGDPILLAEALSELGFAQLFHDDLRAAAATLQRARMAAKQNGDLPRQVRSLTYLAVCHRRLRLVDEVEIEAREGLELAQETGIGVYVATSQANLAWVDFTRRRYLEVEERCRSAIELWRRMDAAFPFFWLAALPLLAVRFARRDLGESRRLAQILLEPEQQRLPDAIAAPLADALRASRDADLRVALAQALSAAEQHTYL